MHHYREPATPMNPTELAQAFSLAKTRAQLKSEDGCAYHVCAVMEVCNGVPVVTGFTLSDWMDGTTLATFSNGREL